jgi:transcriptional regulator with GAF, ATPase, and Fis domain
VIGESDEFRHVLQTVDKIAGYDVPVLLEGETGTGKDLVARALHYRSRRRAQPFVPVNCGALPESLIENELFGHRRGAFTDARDDQPGLVALAHGGTLFLDEVDTLPLKGQVALLQFLQDQHYRPLGERNHAQADVRIIAASTRDLASLCRKDAFRMDLLYRLQLFHLHIPPLRERRGDAALLAAHFVALAGVRFDRPQRQLAPETLDWFERYDWPGNVRELEHVIYREFLLSEEDVLRIPPPEGLAPADTHPSLRYRQAKARAVAQFEARYLGDAMRRAGWNVTVAARLIGTERRHLGRLLRKYGITRAQA